MQIVKIPCKVESEMLPVYQSPGASGADLRADITEEVVLKPGMRIVVPTGLWLSIPDGFEAQVRPRSGLSMQHGITVLNSPGTVDSDYRGEVKVILVNLGDHDFLIRRGDRIAQIVFAPVVKCVFTVETQLDASHRGPGGFGSTGV